MMTVRARRCLRNGSGLVLCERPPSRVCQHNSYISFLSIFYNLFKLSGGSMVKKDDLKLGRRLWSIA